MKYQKVLRFRVVVYLYSPICHEARAEAHEPGESKIEAKRHFYTVGEAGIPRAIRVVHVSNLVSVVYIIV